ncbi:PD-(D/E)XK nuclease family protein [Hydrogenivirga sp. 128-5-R1-1]|uniref:PD-(D/E)XK nuclease family protein n=1 Tax=Hydrogenivirga sp. 128-5-R1-1 TaxID=392423 RepID=UPI00015F2299|nr:PD-(D/E)XK nuclease family protein [Hydrogenivirga sp. 128-5-R1-1]EDP73687.1 ATP-dependent exonuclease (exonuclease V) synthesis protein AddA (helicase and exonuclease domains) [Hydrogenivirga sp. 128-5-R1-1]
MKEEKEREEIKFNFSKNTGENISIYTGIVVHNVLEEVDFTNISLKQLNTLIKKQEKIIPELIKNVVMENSRKILRKFINSPLHKELKESNIIFRELPFTLYENEKYIEGRIDIIYEKDGKIIVMDYKTNRYETEEEKQKVIKAYEKQKEYYLKAVKKIFPEKNIEFKLGLLWKGEVV